MVFVFTSHHSNISTFLWVTYLSTWSKTHIWFLLAYPPHYALIQSSALTPPLIKYHTNFGKKKRNLDPDAWRAKQMKPSKLFSHFLTFFFPCNDLHRHQRRHQAFLFFFLSFFFLQPPIPTTTIRPATTIELAQTQN